MSVVSSYGTNCPLACDISTLYLGGWLETWPLFMTVLASWFLGQVLITHMSTNIFKTSFLAYNSTLVPDVHICHNHGSQRTSVVSNAKFKACTNVHVWKVRKCPLCLVSDSDNWVPHIIWGCLANTCLLVDPGQCSAKVSYINTLQSDKAAPDATT